MKDKDTQINTGMVRFSYVNVWEPRSFGEGPDKYSVCLIIPKSDRETLQRINAAIEKASMKYAWKLGGKALQDLRMPLRDGDIDKAGDEAFKNSYYINASSIEQPDIVDRYVLPIEDREEFYSGCYGIASIRFYIFNVNGSRGIGCRLVNLQKLCDGEKLAVKSSAREDFMPVEDDILL